MLKQQAVLWLALGFLALAEVGVEIRAAARGWDTLVYGKADPPVSQQAGEVVMLYGPTPDFPFRSRVLAAPKPAGTIRVWIASASHAEDVSVAAEAAFPNQLDVVLNERGYQVEVLNAGRAGYGINGNIADLRALSSAWQADVAVLYQMSTELDGLAGVFLKESGSLEQLRPTEGPAEPTETGSTRIARLAEATTSYQLLKGNLTPRVTEQRLLASEFPSEAVAEYRRLVNEFIDTVEELGMTPVLCTFATSHDRRHLGEIPRETSVAIFRYNQHLTLEGWFSAVERLNEALRAIAQERGVRLIDVNNELGGEPDMFRDFVHFNPRGHRAMAEVIAAGLSYLAPPVETDTEHTAARPQ